MDSVLYSFLKEASSEPTGDDEVILDMQEASIEPPRGDVVEMANLWVAEQRSLSYHEGRTLLIDPTSVSFK